MKKIIISTSLMLITTIIITQFTYGQSTPETQTRIPKTNYCVPVLMSNLAVVLANCDSSLNDLLSQGFDLKLSAPSEDGLYFYLTK